MGMPNHPYPIQIMVNLFFKKRDIDPKTQ